MSDIEFVDGLIVKAPHEKAPDYVKGTISIKVADLGAWLREKYKAGEEWVNLDIKQAKSGKYYASVSTYKPKAKAEERTALAKERSHEPEIDSDIPF